MAISSTHAQLLRILQPHLPRGGTLLEIGEANWYGDVEPDFPCQPTDDLFAIAKAFYASLFAPSRIVSIDMHGTRAALKYELNNPLPPLGLFDIVINHGTAEHIFNIKQVFESMHAACKVGGLMIHESPFTGWIDHGFYCLQPTLFYDIAATNGYEIVGAWVEEIKSQTIIRLESRDDVTRQAFPDNSMLYIAFRKQANDQFRIPAQGYYSQTLSDQGREAWETLR